MSDQETSLRLRAIETWARNTIELLEIEHHLEIEQDRQLRICNTLKELERDGHAIRDLIRLDLRPPPENYVIVLTLDDSHRSWINLTKNRLIKGGIIGLTIEESTQPICDGYIVEIQRYTLFIELVKNDFVKIKNFKKFNLIKIMTDIAFRRMKFALRKLIDLHQTNYLIGLLFDVYPIPSSYDYLDSYWLWKENLPFSSIDPDQIYWINSKLNSEQKEAVRFSLYQRNLAVIHGPPGTGKTATLTELILQLVFRQIKPILVCASSNVAVDNIFQQLIDSYQNFCSKNRLKKYHKFVRLGNPLRIDRKIRPYCLEKNRKGERSYYNDNFLKKKIREASVILSTLGSSHIDGQLKYLFDVPSNASFEVVIIDECGQALEAAAWIPLSYAKKCVLGGDHMQLPPTVRSPQAFEQGLNISMLERVCNIFQDRSQYVVRKLSMQYRMNQVIMKWPSFYFYDDQLIASPSVANQRLILNGNTSMPEIRVIDTKGLNMFELMGKSGSSKANMHEAKIVCILVRDFIIQKGLNPSKIGIISPYRLQTSLIEAGCRGLLPTDKNDKLEINPVDGFQGREKDVIIVSLVRSNIRRNIGFLSEERRLNVAITRARKHLTLVGDSDTVTAQSDALKSFFQYSFQNGSVESASVYQEQMNEIEDIDIMVTRFDLINRNLNNQQNGNRSREEFMMARERFFQFKENPNAERIEFPPTLSGTHRFKLQRLAFRFRFRYRIENVNVSGEIRRKLIIYR